MKNLNLLKNEGFFRLGSQEPHSEEKTIIVIGLARSGTSIVAGALFHLGVYMGHLARPPVFEDIHLASAVEDNDSREIERIIKTYNHSHKIWGYKRPSSLKKLSVIHHQSRNPHYIIMFRDIFSIANRNRISVKSDVINNMSTSLAEYETILKFLTQARPNALLIAFDKALNNKDALIDNLISFCGIQPPEECVMAARNFITPDPEDYLESSRITRSNGVIDSATSQGVSGWARYQNNDRPATVCLIVDDKIIAKRTANLFSQQYIDAKIHPKGRCGFYFDDLPIGWDSGVQEIRVKVDDDVHDLKNSPFKLKPLSQVTEPSGYTGPDDVPTKNLNNRQQKKQQVRTIYLHVGLHKTGSTSIQNALYEHSDLLQKNNIYFPRKWVRNHSIPLYMMFCDDDKRCQYHICVRKGLSPSQVDNNRKKYKTTIVKELSDIDFETLVFSGEDVSILNRENLDELKGFFQSLAPGAEFKIIMFLREPLRFMTSRVQTRVKNGQSFSDEHFFRPEKIAYRKMIEKFHDVFGKENVLLHKFEDSLNHPHGLIGFFMELIGIEKSDLPNFRNFESNESLSDKAVEMISYINGRQPLIINSEISEGRKSGDTALLHRIRGDKFQLQKNDAVQKIIEQGRQEIEWLKNNTGIEYPIHVLEKNDSPGNSQQKITYDLDFFDDMIQIYPDLSDCIKKYVHEYVNMLESTAKDKQSRQIMADLLEWIAVYNNMSAPLKSFKNRPVRAFFTNLIGRVRSLNR